MWIKLVHPEEYQRGKHGTSETLQKACKMLALICGLMAACAWAVHDLLVRKIGQEAAILPMMLVVLASGSVGIGLPALVLGDWGQVSSPALGYAAAAGFAYVLGMGGLYRAFSLAPVRLVAPILGAFPMISLGFAALGGKAVSLAEIAAVLAIVGGIAVVALSAEGGDTPLSAPRRRAAILWSLAGTVGFASTFWFAQEAARLGGALPAMLVPRLIALGLVWGGFVLMARPVRPALRELGGTIWVLAGMGMLDAFAIALVTGSASLANPEYAAIASSLFGILTILLAWRLLGEKVTSVQWAGIAIVFAGIGALSAQG